MFQPGCVGVGREGRGERGKKERMEKEIGKERRKGREKISVIIQKGTAIVLYGECVYLGPKKRLHCHNGTYLTLLYILTLKTHVALTLTLETHVALHFNP